MLKLVAERSRRLEFGGVSVLIELDLDLCESSSGEKGEMDGRQGLGACVVSPFCGETRTRALGKFLYYAASRDGWG